MLSILNALIPVFLIIMLGMFLKRQDVFSQSAWIGFENLCYFVLFPVLLIKTLAVAQLASVDVVRYAAVVLFAILTMSALLMVSFPLLKKALSITEAEFTSLFQGATRWHGFIALSIVGLLLGEEGITYMAITMAVIIPPLNIINVSVLARYGEGAADWQSVLRKLAQNPFIIACAIGALLNLSGTGLPQPAYAVLDILGGGALGLGLLTVGAGLHLGQIMNRRSLVAFGALLRLLGMPALMFLGAWLFGVDGVARVVAITAAAVPTAVASFVLARQMGGDAPLMANLITAQVALAAFTLPMWIWLAG